MSEGKASEKREISPGKDAKDRFDTLSEGEKKNIGCDAHIGDARNGKQFRDNLL